jgi:3D-(3,5/4)-trihydroxycyclohexane-1,2-dione acylhydrolase (decyclizing)
MLAERAKAIRAHGTLDAALAAGALPAFADVTAAEGLLLGLLRQGVSKYLAILGHGNTALGEVLRVYQALGVVQVFQCRNEVAMAHAATALRWHYGETSALLTSIGPGALQALAGSLTSASNGVGVWHLYGDETTHGEGYNMQQIPKREQHLFGRLTGVMGESFTLYDPDSLRECLRRGAARVHHPFRAGPFYVQLPINVQPRRIARLHLAALPQRPEPQRIAPADDRAFAAAVDLIRRHRRIVVKLGGGARRFSKAVASLLEATGAVAALSPGAIGTLPDAHPRNLHVGGSKGTLCGNHAMARADLLIAVGSRAVCQADCSGTGFENAEAVININGDAADAAHYNRSLALVGSIDAVIERLVAALERDGGVPAATPWLAECAEQKARWTALRAERCSAPPLEDDVWGRPVLTQPAAIGAIDAFARRRGAVKYFDAGDVQANGFQIAADEAPNETFTDTGASYMGFAASALLASALADDPRYCIAVVGDGSFLMNPQILVDGVEHGVRGAIAVLDNRRMAAISGLQIDQYGSDFATNDAVAVDYAALAEAVGGGRVLGLFGGDDRASLEAALERAHAHDGLSLIHVPVYWGDDPRGGMGVYGRWNVGDWCDEVQERYHSQLL